MPKHSDGVRPARIDDAEGLWPLARDFAASFRPDRSAFDRTWTQLIGASGTLLLVAEDDRSDIVGYLLGNVHPTFLANGPVAWIEELMVDAGHRRTGVGGRLVRRAESWAADNDAAYLALATRRAEAFYAALGYERSAVYFKKSLVAGSVTPGPAGH